MGVGGVFVGYLGTATMTAALQQLAVGPTARAR